MSQITIAPQPGFQVKALSCSADIAILGASAGVGKTWTILFDPLRYYDVPRFNATIFRRTFPQINGPGQMWEKSTELYPYFGGKPAKTDMEWRFEKSKFYFKHWQNYDDWMNIQGAEMCYIAFDELTHFEKGMFTKALNWNRSTCGVTPYLRATCNPDPDSFVAELVDWWIGDDGFPIPERDGVMRYMTMLDDNYFWGNSKAEVYEQTKHKLDLLPVDEKDKMKLIKSFTFIKGSVYDNKELLKVNPEYLGNLLAGTEEEQMRFLYGNWKVKLDKDILFKYSSFNDIFTNTFVLKINREKGCKRYITSDIATTGRDLFITAYWEGKAWMDIEIVAKNSGKEAVETIERVKLNNSVANSCTLYDADGVGGGMTGWIKNCVEFHGNKKVIGKENYKNLKSQCFFELSYCINQVPPKIPDDCYYVSEKVANTVFRFDTPARYKGKTVAWILLDQMKAIRKDKPEMGDTKLAIIPKDEQKSYIQGVSPDFIEQFAYREYFELANYEPIKVKIN